MLLAIDLIGLAAVAAFSVAAWQFADDIAKQDRVNRLGFWDRRTS